MGGNDRKNLIINGVIASRGNNFLDLIGTIIQTDPFKRDLIFICNGIYTSRFGSVVQCDQIPITSIVLLI